MIDPATSADEVTPHEVSDADLAAASGGTASPPAHPFDSDGPSVGAVIF